MAGQPLAARERGTGPPLVLRSCRAATGADSDPEFLARLAAGLRRPAELAAG